jgi:hypothetical protein
VEFIKYFSQLCRLSWRGTLRLLEILEAIAAVTCYSLKFFFPQLDHLLEVVSLFIVILLVVTFIFGLIWAAFRIDKEKERQIHESEKSDDDDWYTPGMMTD